MTSKAAAFSPSSLLKSEGTASSPPHTEEIHHSALLYDIYSSVERKKKGKKGRDILSIWKPKFIIKEKKKKKDGCGDIRDYSGNHHPLVRRGLLYHH